ncbi:MAG TPA: hypothetical protein VHU40_03085 [Polyangia bacterium]|jgi:hypothetical protein|nr:hypothetical protein [Polyangia bacterium]
MSVGGQHRSQTPRAATLRLLGAWAVLDVLCNARFPGPEPALWYLLPSIDATLLLAVVAGFATRGRRVPRALVVAASVVVAAIRLFRIGDGVNRRYFNRPLTLGLDLPLAMDLVRLLKDTLSSPFLLVGLPLALAVFVGIGVVAARALRSAERALDARAGRVAFVTGVALTALASLFVPKPDDAHRTVPGTYVDGAASEPLRTGAFGASAFPRLVREFGFAAHLDRYRAAQAARMDAVGRTLVSNPHGLELLNRAPVFLCLIESYGAVTLDQLDHAQRLGSAWDAATSALTAHGFTVASSLLDSPTYAGRSWLAHTTLTTGVRATELVTDRLVQDRQPVSLARFFHDAGYRTVLVQPANHYPNLWRWLYDFDKVYSGWDFDYRGPTYAWARMPDQYVLDFVHRHEVAVARQPLLVAYTLITSHAPWSALPPVIADWPSIGDGTTYRAQATTHFPITWTNLPDAAEAYDRSVIYDLDVITDYASRFLPPDALVIVLGDHQPVAEVTRFSASTAVPIHVFSRNRALVAPFLARGFTSGLRPVRTDRPPRGMEFFLPDLLADFSKRAP